MLQVCRNIRQTTLVSYELTRAGGGDAFSSYTIRPGTTPLTRDGRFHAAFPRFRAHVPGGLYRLPNILFLNTPSRERPANSQTF